MFSAAPVTRFDLNFNVLGFPVRVHPLFWVIAILLGSGSDNLLMIPVWMVIVFVSILVHELGHALAFRRYGQPASILLHFSGGVTIPTTLPWGGGYASVGLTPNQHIMISLAGPIAGFLLAGLTLAVGVALGGEIILTTIFGVLPFPIVLMPYGSIFTDIFITLLWVNVFWGVINLLPVYPLDGGQVARYFLIQRDPYGGLRMSLWVSIFTGGLLAIAGFLAFRSMYTAFLFGFLAFQSYQMLQGLGNRY